MIMIMAIIVVVVLTSDKTNYNGKQILTDSSSFLFYSIT